MPSQSTVASRLRFIGALLAAGALVVGALPGPAAAQAVGGGGAQGGAASCVRLELDNPHPGDNIPAGDYTVSGRAVDTSGANVDRVQIFLGDRNLGGTPIGEADIVPGTSAPASVAQSFLGGNGAFTVLTDASSSNTDVGPQTLFAYARSTSGTEVSVAVPVVLIGRGFAGGPGGAFGTTLPSVSTSADCPPPAPPSNIVSATGTSVTGTSAVAPPTERISVSIESPNPGATITRGKFEVDGRATSSTGAIDRIQVFLGNRDLGGVSLGEITAANSPMPVPNSNLSSTLNSNGTYRLIVDFPSQNLGTNTVFVYARSGTSGKEGSAATSVTVNR